MKKLFAGICLVWLILALSLGYCLSTASQLASVMRWVTQLWAMSVLDLVALSMALGAAIRLTDEHLEKRGPVVIQAFYWGGLKLACLIFFAGVLIKAVMIPPLGMALGLGTLVVVPLVGGTAYGATTREKRRETRVVRG